MKTYQRLLVFFLAVTLVVSFTYVSRAQSEEVESIHFPIADLGNCGSKDECRVYCDDEAHHDACVMWAQGNGLYKNTGTRPAARTGPGGCDSRQACDAFCRNPENTSTCVEFAVSDGRMTRDQADSILEAMRLRDRHAAMPRPVDVPKKPRVSVEPKIDVEKAKAILETQGGPGGCASFNECEAFCNNPANEETCFQFAVDHELMRSADIERMQKLRSAEGPGGCRGRQCEGYCEQPGHEQECIEFAHKEGLIEEKEYHEVKKFLDASKDGGPGGCQGRACEQYCNDPAHRKECFAFAKEHDLIPEHEAEAIDRIEKKLEDGGGPGGCRSEEECHQYCADPAHTDACMAFAVDAGLLPPDQARNMMRKFNEHDDRKSDMLPEGVPPANFHGEFQKRFDEEYKREFENRAKQFEGQRGPMPEFKPPVSGEFRGTDGYMQGMPPMRQREIPFPNRELPKEGIISPEGVVRPEGFMPSPHMDIPQGFVPPERIMEEQKYQEKFQYTPGELQVPPADYRQPEGSFMSPPPSVPDTKTGASPFQVFLDLLGLHLR